MVLWWPARRHQLVDRLRVKWRASGKRVNYDLHRTGGFYAAGMLVLIALTGTTLVYKDGATAAVARLAGRPAPEKPTVTRPADGAAPRPLPELLRRADAALPAGDVRRLTFPAKADASLIVRKRLPGELHPNGVNYIYLDPYSGMVLRVDRAAAGDAGQRFLNARYPLHIGLWGGLFSRCLHALAGLVPATLFITGLVMWWNRGGAKRLALASRQRRGHMVTTASTERI